MSFGVTELLILLAIVALVFGTKRLRNIGGDLGSAVSGFRDAVKEGDDNKALDDDSNTSGTTIDAEVTQKEPVSKE